MIFYLILSLCCLIPLVELKRYERMGYVTPGPFMVSLGVLALWIAIFPYYLLKVRPPIEEAMTENGDRAPNLVSDTAAWFIYVLGLLIVLLSLALPYVGVGIANSDQSSVNYAMNSPASSPDANEISPVSVRFLEEIKTNLFTSEAYSERRILNSGVGPLNISWVLINNREDCFGVPIYDYKRSGVQSIKVLLEGSTEEVADKVSLEVGQSIALDTRGTSCGELIRVKLGTDVGEFDVDPYG
jgi:hypothetical protein